MLNPRANEAIARMEKLLQEAEWALAVGDVEAAIKRYLADGGKIVQIPPGVPLTATEE